MKLKLPWKKKKEEAKQEVKPAENLDTLKVTVEKKYVEYLHSLQSLDESINKTKQSLSELTMLISQVEDLRNTNKEEVEKLKQIVANEPTKIQEYEKKVEELGQEVDRIIENYKNAIKSLHTDVIQPYKELLKQIEDLEEKKTSISEKLKEYMQKIDYHKNLAKKVVENPVILSILEILEKYTERKKPEEEATLVKELLNESPDTLRYAIKIGKEDLGYTNNQLWVIIAAYLLKSCEFGKGIDENLCKEIDVSKKEVENYIVDIAVKTEDSEARKRIINEMYKGYSESSHRSIF